MDEALIVGAKFHNENKKIITAKDKFTAEELEAYMKKCILNRDFLPNTKFILVAGVNHSKTTEGEVVLSGTDFKLVEEFEHKLFSNLYEIKDQDGDLIWDKMNFDDELITVACNYSMDMATFEKTYQLSIPSLKRLEKLAKDLCNKTILLCVIFASSYSYFSPINNLLKASTDNTKDEDDTVGSIDLDEKFSELLSSTRVIKETSKADKFHNENSNFITANVAINATDLETHIKERILNGDFFPNTKFVIVAGSHHRKKRDGEVVPGATDYKLLQSFEHKVFSRLHKLKDCDGNNIWDKMNFSYELVTLACSTFDGEVFDLSKRSKRKLTKLAKDLCDQNNPICIVFASCYSFQSPIKDFLIEIGVLAAIDISKDRGEISGGRIFAFDEDQKELNDILTEVLH